MLKYYFPLLYLKISLYQDISTNNKKKIKLGFNSGEIYD